MMKELVFATNNAHKLQEVRSILSDRINVKSLQEIGCDVDIPETGSTLVENAGIKSRYVFQQYRVDCFADDSGLEVEALGGEPGVYSARYSGSRDMEANINFLLKKLKDKTNRQASFKTVISLIIDGREYLFEGVVQGQILHEKVGTEGFGYDPIFVPDGYSKTFAEMDPAEKNAISHRAMAVAGLTDFLFTL